MDERRNVIGYHNIAGNNLRNVGNITNITVSHPMGSSGQPLTLESKVAFGALLNSRERYPAPHCHPGTCVAPKKVVKDWIGRRGFGSEKRIMWISGPPGVGKSAILQTVCEELNGRYERDFVSNEEDDGLINACYFFGQGMGDREKASFFPATIAYQLVLSRPSCGAAIRTTMAKNPSILLESFPSQFCKLVLRPAKAHAASDAPVTIVIDALDECDSVHDQVSLLNAIYEGATTANMRFVIASRPEEHIQAFFQRTTVSEHTYHIRLDDDFKASRDIEIFLHDKFAGIRERTPGLCARLPNGEEWPGSVVIYRLRDKSDGQFLYATLVIAFIDTPYFLPDQQLELLLAAPPARAFSELDALYHHILSRCPPELLTESDELLDFRKLVMGILRVVVCWPEPLSVSGIARVLDKEVHEVQTIIHGPIRSLFKFDPDNFASTIGLCYKSLRDYLLDRLRSQEFFLLAAESPDALYIEILSRQPRSSIPLQLYCRDDLMGVLTMIVAWPVPLNVPRIASVLGVAPSLVESVISGPARALFTLDGPTNNVHLFDPVQDFLLDAGRAGEYLISSRTLDTIFIRILSRQPPSDPSHSYSQEVLTGVLSVVLALGGRVKVPQIASLLDIAPNLVESVIFGPGSGLFEVDGSGDVHLFGLMQDFLLDPGRAGEYLISSRTLDTIFIRILSRQPPSDPSHSYSQGVLMGILSVVLALGGRVKVPQIASLLDIAPNLVESVIFGPGSGLFEVDGSGDVRFSIFSFKKFLLDADRAGEYFIPNDNLPDTTFIRILSRQPSKPFHTYSQDDLMGVLTVLSVWSNGPSLTAPQIASSLDIDPNTVEGIVFGLPVFYLCDDGGVSLFSEVSEFLEDADRAGKFYIPPDDLNPNYHSLRAKIKKIRYG